MLLTGIGSGETEAEMNESGKSQNLNRFLCSQAFSEKTATSNIRV
jgi:hypothetical protein